ncbi:prenyltransferase, partial [Actinosynnema sp.]
MTATRATGPRLSGGAVARAVADLVSDPTGGLPASVYETARLVALAPWLVGHAERVDFLLRDQAPDGTWAGPGPFALVPTLSAVEALLAAEADRGAVDRGLAAAERLLADVPGTGLPATLIPGMIVPALVLDVNARLGHDRLRLPDGLSPDALVALRDDGWRNPVSAFYLEIVGPRAVGSPHVRPVDGVVGCSAAATAAWLGPEPPGQERAESVRFLERTQAGLGGPVPGLTSMTWFERGLLHSALIDSGVDPAEAAPLLTGLPLDVGERGAPAAPGFAHDSETAAILLLAESDATGSTPAPDSLWEYDRGTHFLTTVPVGAPSVITNARILRALRRRLAQNPPDAARCADAADRITDWLLAEQNADGHWTDRWHQSPLYATQACLQALAEPGRAATSRTRDADVAEARAAALRLLLSTQRPDGSWGVWGGTVEETALALLALP